jgi:acyl carrier protein
MESIEAITQKSQDIVLEIMPNVSREELRDDMDLFSLGLDSINAMMLIMNLQDGFGVTFGTDEINFENFRTLANIVELIKKKQGIPVAL